MGDHSLLGQQTSSHNVNMIFSISQGQRTDLIQFFCLLYRGHCVRGCKVLSTISYVKEVMLYFHKYGAT